MYFKKVNFVAKVCKYGIFVAKIYKYALNDSFLWFAGFLDSSADLAALGVTPNTFLGQIYQVLKTLGNVLCTWNIDIRTPIFIFNCIFSTEFKFSSWPFLRWISSHQKDFDWNGKCSERSEMDFDSSLIFFR